MSTILITGPSRSGKSEWAEQLAEAQTIQQQVVYIATAQTQDNDTEWQSRIDAHRFRRPEHWQCLEVPMNLAEAIAHHDKRHCLLIDSLGTWLANLIENSAEDWEFQQDIFLTALQQTDATVICVAEETGWGIVPAYELGRRFRDRLGSLSRKVGAIATETYLVTSGYALPLSQLAQPVQGVTSDVTSQHH